MKIKQDFVTNSSSTSFILTFKSEAKGEKEFIDKFNCVLEDYIKDNAWNEEFQAPPLLTSEKVKQTGQGTFVINDYLPMDKGAEDISQSIKDIFISNNSDACKKLDSAGIRATTVEIKDFNE